MHISLIIPYSDITSFGVRTLAATVKQSGHKVTLIFLNDPEGETLPNYHYIYSQSLLEAVYNQVKETDLIGFSLMTLYFERISQLTQYLRKKIDVPIIWGGIHPTIKPEDCLQFADAVAIGEAERPLQELLQHYEKDEDITATPGFWFKKNNEIIKNIIPSPVINLDELPAPDYFPEKQFVLSQSRDTLQPITEELYPILFKENPIWKMGSNIYYQTMATRGCPHNCSYCCNSAFRNIHRAHWKVRYRSPSHVIDELLEMRKNFPFINAIVLSDDSFFAYSLEQIEEFSALYKKKINFPFRCLTSPLTLSREKLELLLDAGMFSLQMGIQTGSPKTQKLYQRSIKNETVLSATSLINEYKDKMDPPLYDFILDNPFETIEDQIETVNLVKKIPRPYFLQLFSLVIFPGTKLYDIASDLIALEALEGYRKPFNDLKPTYINILLLLFHYQTPMFLMKILSNPVIIRWLSIPPFSIIIKKTFEVWKQSKKFFYETIIT